MKPSFMDLLPRLGLNQTCSGRLRKESYGHCLRSENACGTMLVLVSGFCSRNVRQVQS